MSEDTRDPRGPLFVAAYDFWKWAADHCDAGTFGHVAGIAMGHHARGLVEAVTLAAERFDRQVQLEEADRHCALLRLHIRVAHDRGLVTEAQLFFALECLRNIGRQIGGWLRALDQAL